MNIRLVYELLFVMYRDIIFILAPLLCFASVLFSSPPSSPDLEKKLVTAASTRKKDDATTLLALSTPKKTSTVVNKEGRQSTVSLNTDNNEPQAKAPGEAENPLSFTDVGRIFSIIRDNFQQEGDAYKKEQAMLGSLKQADQKIIPTDETNGMNEYLDEYLAN